MHLGASGLHTYQSTYFTSFISSLTGRMGETAIIFVSVLGAELNDAHVYKNCSNMWPVPW